MKLNRSFFNLLGIAAALALPAIVVAQTFQARTVLSAAALQQLESRVAELESGMGSPENVGDLTANGSVTMTARSDGFLVATPGGSGLNAINVEAAINASGRIFRASSGNSLSVILANGDSATVTVAGISGNSVLLRWFPLRRNGAVPTCAGAGCP